LDAFLPCERALRQKLLYPERGMQYYLVPGSEKLSRARDVAIE
jgi:hypothetical protein